VKTDLIERLTVRKQEISVGKAVSVPFRALHVTKGHRQEQD